jgi:hypothetical protein
VLVRYQIERALHKGRRCKPRPQAVALLTDRHPGAGRYFKLPHCRAICRACDDTSQCFRERLKTNSQRPLVSRISVAAVLSSHRVGRAFRRSAMMGRNGFLTPRSLKSEHLIRARPGKFLVTNPK